MLAADAQLKVSVPSAMPQAYTSPGISDLVIWMKETER